MVKYEHVRKQIKSGDLIALTHREWGSWYDVQVQVVRLASQSEYSHVGVAWVIGGRVFVLESVTGGVRAYPLSKEKGFYWIRIPGIKWNKLAEEAALSKFGEGYSKWEAIKAYFGKIKNVNSGPWECAKFCLFVYSFLTDKFNCKAVPSSMVQNALELGATLTYVEV